MAKWSGRAKTRLELDQEYNVNGRKWQGIVWLLAKLERKYVNNAKTSFSLQMNATVRAATTRYTRTRYK